MDNFDDLQARLRYRFNDPGLLRLALTHPSVAHEQGAPVQTNQRLEYLGDAVLQLVLTAELYEKFPDFGEGPLTKARAKLVNRRTLAERARQLGLGSNLLLSRGEDLHGGRDRPSALADTFEAVLGAIFLDGGFVVAREFILREFLEAFGQLSVIPTLENPKGELQEFLQSTSTEAPRYHVVSATGPDHDRSFECTVHHGGVELARGEGKSKKEAESAAALAALTVLREKNKPPRLQLRRPTLPLTNMKSLFELHRQVLIGVVHLQPLPGSPRWQGDLKSLVRAAVNDARAYERGGAHALFVENFGDVPFTKSSVGPETVAAMAVAGSAIREAVKLPFGFNVLRNDARAALALCSACGGSFVRVNVHTGAMLTDLGLADGFIVGSSLKAGGELANPVDPRRVAALVKGLAGSGKR